MAARLGVLYVAILFPVAFLFGALRTVILVPLSGPLIAVLIELPVILTVAYVLCISLLRKVPRLTKGEAMVMGAVAFALLMLAELAVAVTLFDMTAHAFLAGFGTLHGAVGLAGQIAFAALPVWLRDRS
ncbi:hypothetical protein [Shimia sp. SDUM112013]|uniref:hypothetical protein n=1 Tax=Shimia sp. SDUM112013 TaxID=3136160 RepID=UPI0032EB3F81